MTSSQFPQGLPFSDEIYDLDTKGLQSLLERLKLHEQNELTDRERKKAKELADVVTLEIEERALAANFEENCLQILSGFEDAFTEAQGAKFEPEIITNKQEIAQDKRNRHLLPPIDKSVLKKDEVNVANSSTISGTSGITTPSHCPSNITKQTDAEVQGLVPIYDFHDHHRNKVLQKKMGGKSNWLDFVKQTLNSTKVEQQVFSVGAGAFKKPHHHRERQSSNDQEPRQRSPPASPKLSEKAVAAQKRREQVKEFDKMTREIIKSTNNRQSSEGNHHEPIARNTHASTKNNINLDRKKTVEALTAGSQSKHHEADRAVSQGVSINPVQLNSNTPVGFRITSTNQQHQTGQNKQLSNVEVKADGSAKARQGGSAVKKQLKKNNTMDATSTYRKNVSGDPLENKRSKNEKNPSKVSKARDGSDVKLKDSKQPRLVRIPTADVHPVEPEDLELVSPCYTDLELWKSENCCYIEAPPPIMKELLMPESDKPIDPFESVPSERYLSDQSTDITKDKGQNVRSNSRSTSRSRAIGNTGSFSKNQAKESIGSSRKSALPTTKGITKNNSGKNKNDMQNTQAEKNNPTKTKSEKPDGTLAQKPPRLPNKQAKEESGKNQTVQNKQSSQKASLNCKGDIKGDAKQNEKTPSIVEGKTQITLGSKSSNQEKAKAVKDDSKVRIRNIVQAQACQNDISKNNGADQTSSKSQKQKQTPPFQVIPGAEDQSDDTSDELNIHQVVTPKVHRGKQQPEPAEKPGTDLRKTIKVPLKQQMCLTSDMKLIIPEPMDYSEHIPTWNHVFSEFYFLKGSELDVLSTMREGIFIRHNDIVKKIDNKLLDIAFNLSPLELGMHDMIYQNDVFRMMNFVSKTCLNWATFKKRQEIYLSTLNKEETISEEPELNLPEGQESSCAVIQTRPSCNHQFFRVVKSKTEVYDIITKSFYRREGWRELPHGLNLGPTWNLLWTWGKINTDFKRLIVFQKINHFLNIKHISRKDNLKKSLDRLMGQSNFNQSYFRILPETFVIPRDYAAFATLSVQLREVDPEQVWIVKPAALSRGRGIYLINNFTELSYNESMVVQRYIKNPLLIDGFKFDLRIYVLVTSFQPLEVFLYKEGFARFASEPFTLDPEELGNKFVHLTNYSIQKNHIVNRGKDSKDQAFFEDNGSKITLTKLRSKFRYMEEIWEQIKLLIIKSLVAAQPNIGHQPNAFELLGYDILIDQNYQCWLIEVNCSPSLHKEHLIDEIIKQSLIDDIVDLLEPPKFDHERLLDVLSRRIAEEQRHKSKITIHNNTKETLNRDLTYILRGKKLRKVGEMPANPGCFEMIAPSEMSARVENHAKSGKKTFTPTVG